MASLSSSTVEDPKSPMPITSYHNSEDIDRISNLPESLLCHILSFLTTKEAAVTSTLSTKWRKQWTAVPAIHLQEEEIPFAWHSHRLIRATPRIISEKPRTRFSYILKRVLVQRSNHYLKKLHLVSRYHSYDPTNFMVCVKYAVASHIEEVDLELFFVKNIDLPITLFTCKTLVVLKLSGNINIMSIPSSINLPSLKIADLMHVPFANVSPISRFLTGCPIIEDFSMYLMTNVPLCSLKISKPSLQKLRVSCQCCIYDVTKLEIDTPSLKFLDIEATSILDYSVKNAHNVVEAKLNVSVENGPKDCVFDIFKALREIRFMSLSLFTIETFTKTSTLDLPEFPNLVRLVLTISYCNSNLLVKLLQKCPNLEDLVIQKETFDGDETLWIEPTSIPHCLSSHLTKFSFKGYIGSKNELGLAAYILKGANLLKTVTIQIYYLLHYMTEKIDIQDQLSMVPRASASCELVFEQSRDFLAL